MGNRKVAYNDYPEIICSFQMDISEKWWPWWCFPRIDNCDSRTDVWVQPYSKSGNWSVFRIHKTFFRFAPYGHVSKICYKKIYRCTANTCPNSKLTPNLKYCWYFSRGTLQILIFLVKQYSSRRVFSGRRFARRQVCPMTATWPSSG